VSTLSISSAMVMDSGNYSCSLPSSDLSDEVEVSVQLGDHFQQLKPSSSCNIEIVDPYNIVIVMVVYSLITYRS
jgi:hypothetical protein